MLFGSSFTLCRPRFNVLAFDLSDSLCERIGKLGSVVFWKRALRWSTYSSSVCCRDVYTFYGYVDMNESW
jgi:hypothetical protein